jgi:hypothetical protein
LLTFSSDWPQTITFPIFTAEYLGLQVCITGPSIQREDNGSSGSDDRAAKEFQRVAGAEMTGNRGGRDNEGRQK